MSSIYYNGLPLSGSFNFAWSFRSRVVVSQLLRINLACLLFRYIVFKVLGCLGALGVSRDSFDSIPPRPLLVNPFFYFFTKKFFRFFTRFSGGSGKYFTILN